MKYKSDFLYTKKLSTDLLKMASPYPTLESGGFKRVSNVKDPGFKVRLKLGESEEDTDIASTVLNNAWAQLRIEWKNDKLTYKVKFKNVLKEKVLEIDYKTK